MVIRMDAINLKETIEPSLDNDKLGIKEQHDSTINLILGITGSATIAITSQYGGGKTFFAKCLENTLKNEHKDRVNTVYVDLWSNDYKNPLATFISSLDTIKDNNDLSQLKEIAIKTLPIISFGVKLFTGVPTDKTEELFKNLLNGEDKKDIDGLKKEIKKLAKDKKLVFLVDEIDRCRPEYAIETLETIKHFFELDNIIFILFINSSYIDNIESQYIKYGIGSHGYIEKFIDKTILLDIKPKNYINLFPPVYNEDYRDNIDYISILPDFFSLSTRDVIKILKNMDVFFKFYPHFSPYRTNTNYERYNNSNFGIKLKEEKYYGLFYTFLMYTLKLKKENDFRKITIEQDINYLSEVISDLDNLKINANKNEQKGYIKDTKSIDQTIILLQNLINGINDNSHIKIYQENNKYSGNRDELIFSIININMKSSDMKSSDLTGIDIDNFLSKWLSALNN